MNVTGVERITDGGTPVGEPDSKAPFTIAVQTPSGPGDLEVTFDAANQLLAELTRALNARGITLGDPKA